jgi:hypothetical protein
MKGGERASAASELVVEERIGRRGEAGSVQMQWGNEKSVLLSAQHMLSKDSVAEKTGFALVLGRSWWSCHAPAGNGCVPRTKRMKERIETLTPS